MIKTFESVVTSDLKYKYNYSYYFLMCIYIYIFFINFQYKQFLKYDMNRMLRLQWNQFYIHINDKKLIIKQLEKNRNNYK